MKMNCLDQQRWIACFVGVTLASALAAVEPRRLGGDEARQIEMFAAMKAGDIDVKFIPRNAEQANILIENKTNKPLHIELPEAFAAVPVLAQFGGQGGGGFGGGGLGGGGLGGGGLGGGGGQGVGGGLGGGGLGGGGLGGGGAGFGGGGGFMRIAPEKKQRIAVATVCLEHGKPDPKPKMEYTIIPIKEFTKDEHVIALCTELGYGRLPQNTAQAIAWHYTDDMSWKELSEKNRIESKYTGNVPFFSKKELQAAVYIAQRIQQYVSESPKNDSDKDERSETENYASRETFEPVK